MSCEKGVNRELCVQLTDVQTALELNYQLPRCTYIALPCELTNQIFNL
jgi:hypothetical protein